MAKLTNTVVYGNNTPSTSNTTGALIVQGGLGITGNLYAGNVVVTGSGNGITFVDGTRQTTAYNAGVDTAQNTSITLIQGVDTSQNTRIDAAFNKANTGALTSGYLSNSVIFADSSGNLANTNNIKFFTTNNMLLVANTTVLGNLIVAGADFTTVNNTQNTNISIVQGGLNTANDNIALAIAVDAYQNTYATAAFTKANNALPLSGGTLTGSLTLSNSSDLTVTGNLYITGNTFSANVGTIETRDTVILLGIGNYSTDVVDIGLAGHYNNGTNAHTGLVRDSGTKEWYLFEGYTPEFTGNNNIIITDPSFKTSILNANVVKANLIATNAIIGGMDVNTVNNTQNTNIAIVQGGLNTANANISLIQGVDAYQNNNISIVQGGLNTANSDINLIELVDNSQNTRMSSIETVDNNQNSAITLIQAVDNYQNNNISIVQGGLDTANADINLIKGVDVSQNTRIDAAFDKANTDVTNISISPGAYGSSSLVPVVTVAANGRITNITTTAVSGGGGSGTAGYHLTIERQSYTATQGQTTFSINYTAPYVYVTVNGVTIDSSEYSAGSGTSIVLTTPANLNDIVDITGYVQNNSTNAVYTITNTTESTSTSTGALIVYGGVGVGGDLWANNIYTTGDRVSIGGNAGQISQNSYSVAVGYDAGQTNQGVGSTAIGADAGNEYQGNFAVAVGIDAGRFSQNSWSIAIGPAAGRDYQQNNAIAVGNSAGQISQSFWSVAIGDNAGQTNQGAGAVSVGAYAGYLNQQKLAIGIGTGSGAENQNTSAIAIGTSSGSINQGNNAIAIGTLAGQTNQGNNSIAIGTYAGYNNQPYNSIIINASDLYLQDRGRPITA